MLSIVITSILAQDHLGIPLCATVLAPYVCLPMMTPFFCDFVVLFRSTLMKHDDHQTAIGSYRDGIWFMFERDKTATP